MLNLTDNRSLELGMKHMDRHDVTIMGLFCAFRVMILQNICSFVNRTDRNSTKYGYSNGSIWPESEDGAMFLFWYSPTQHPSGSVFKVKLCKRRGCLTINAICPTLILVTYSVKEQRTVNREPSHAIYEYQVSSEYTMQA
jgi:hypothetical protein